MSGAMSASTYKSGITAIASDSALGLFDRPTRTAKIWGKIKSNLEDPRNSFCEKYI